MIEDERRENDDPERPATDEEIETARKLEEELARRGLLPLDKGEEPPSGLPERITEDIKDKQRKKDQEE